MWVMRWCVRTRTRSLWKVSLLLVSWKNSGNIDLFSTNKPNRRLLILTILNLETSALSTTTSTFKLATFRADIGSGLATRSTRNTKVLHSSTSCATTLQQHRVRTSGAAESQLVEGDALTTSLQDASTSRFCEVKGTHLQSRHFHHADIVRNGANDNSNLVLLTLHVSGERIQAHGRTVDSAHVETSKNDGRELSTRTTSNEAVKLQGKQKSTQRAYLDQESEIHVITLGSFTGLVSTVTTSSD